MTDEQRTIAQVTAKLTGQLAPGVRVKGKHHHYTGTIRGMVDQMLHIEWDNPKKDDLLPYPWGSNEVEIV